MKIKEFIKNHKTAVIRTLAVLIILGLIAAGAVAATNAAVIKSTEESIVTASEAGGNEADCVLILGCGVRDDGQPCMLLRDRLDRGIELYKSGAASKIIMSGDHGRKAYDEVNTMKRYAMERGVPPEDIFMDHAGFSTYESMYRARDIFEVKSLIIVTQEYHLSRALYDAQALGLDAKGVKAKEVRYSGQIARDARELLARTKDYIYAALQPEPTYLGETIPITGDGNLTNDQYTDLSYYDSEAF